MAMRSLEMDRNNVVHDALVEIVSEVEAWRGHKRYVLDAMDRIKELAVDALEAVGHEGLADIGQAEGDAVYGHSGVV
jgi:hypothetical protein